MSTLSLGLHRALLSVMMSTMICYALTPENVSAQPAEQRIYQTDSVGNIRYHVPSWTVQPDGRVIETNRYGEKMHHKQQYKIVGDQVMPVDSVGNPQPNKSVSTRR
jgi:hypothetical protein